MAGYQRKHGEAIERARQAHRVYSAAWADLRMSGAKPFVISRREHREQWEAWRQYFHLHGLFMLLEMMDDKPEKTVPTLWPHEFEQATKPALQERRHADG